MTIKRLRFATILLAALAMGMKLTHAFELAPKLEWSPDLYLAVQTSLYRVFGRIGPFLEVGAFLCAATLAYRLRGQRAFAFTLVGALSILASLTVWVVFVLPANGHINAWAASGTMPEDWMHWRAQWQYGQAATFALHLTALSALVASILGDTPRG